MTESSGIFDAANPADPDREYSAATLMSIVAKILRDGIVHNDGDELAVVASDPPAMSIVVGTGTAIVQGRYYVNDADLSLDVDTADPSYPRIDRIVLQLIATPSRRINATVKKGTAATSPTAPALTRTSEIWELSLAQIAVGAGVTSISSANITDERSNAPLCGDAVPAYVPSSQFEVVQDVAMAGHKLTGLPVPSAATDAARRDMGGVTLQNLGAPSAATDAARRDMGGVSLQNLGAPSAGTDAARKTDVETALANAKVFGLVPVASDTLRKTYTLPTPVTCTPTGDGYSHTTYAYATIGLPIPPRYVPGTVKVIVAGSGYSYGVRVIDAGGNIVSDHHIKNTPTNISVKGGDILIPIAIGYSSFNASGLGVTSHISGTATGLAVYCTDTEYTSLNVAWP